MPILAFMTDELVLLDDSRYHAQDVELVVQIYGGTVVTKFHDAYLRDDSMLKTYEDLAKIPKIGNWTLVRSCKLVYTLRVLRAAAEDKDDQDLLDDMIEERLSRTVKTLTCVRVIAAAILVDGKTHWSRPPARHHDLIKLLAASGIEENKEEHEQGFLLSDGSFAMRDRAWEVAEAAGQLLMRDRERPGMLFSEDLW